MDNSAICQKLDEAIENFMKDSSMFPEGSSEPVTKNDLHIFSVMVLNALGDVKKAFEQPNDAVLAAIRDCIFFLHQCQAKACFDHIKRMEYSAFTFSVPDINIGLVSVFTVDIDLVDVAQSHSVHHLSLIVHCVYLAFPSMLSYTVLTGSRQSRVLRKELYILDSNNVVHELTMLYLNQKDISSLTPEELLDEYEKVYTKIKKKKSEKNGEKWSS